MLWYTLTLCNYNKREHAMWEAREDVTCDQWISGFDHGILFTLLAHFVHLLLIADFTYSYAGAALRNGICSKKAVQLEASPPRFGTCHDSLRSSATHRGVRLEYYLVPGPWFLVLGPWSHGTWCLVLGSWCPVLGFACFLSPLDSWVM